MTTRGGRDMGKQALNLSQMDKRADKGASLRRGCIDSVDGDIALVFVDGHDDAMCALSTTRPKSSNHCAGAMAWTRRAPPSSSNTTLLEAVAPLDRRCF